MKTKSILLSSQYQNRYLYSEKHKYFMYIPEEFAPSLDGKQDETPKSYYYRKLKFLEENHFFEKEDTIFQTVYDEEDIKQNLACLRQLLIEVTDSCNLKCKYCGYGEFYSNYDKRETKNQTFENVKVLIDYLSGLWNSPYNTSINNNVIISFYGGEPLLNMDLIKATVEYVESLKTDNITFSYSFTTNGTLLSKNMDFLVEKDFSILISLDGNEYHSAYRVDKSGRNSYHRVIQNIEKLREKYPEYFDKRVSFNAVLHDLNSVEESHKAIFERFGKNAKMSELNTNGILEEKRESFYRMFNSKVESFRFAMKKPEVKESLKLEDADSIRHHTMLMNYSGNFFKTLMDLFDSDKDDCYVPTGTCRPFERKLFLTVNGKILACEKIGHEHVLANLTDGILELDFKYISDYYNELYQKNLTNCLKCILKRSCGQCVFLLKEAKGKMICPLMQSESNLRNNFVFFLTYSENDPNSYEELLSSITID